MTPNPTLSTPPPPARPASGGGSFMAGLAVGLAGLVVIGGFAAVFGSIYVSKKAADARRGWNLVPVVVAAQDIPENAVVTFDMISQRSVPEQFVTSSVVKPDSASYIVNQKVLVALQAGDLLLWSQFETSRAAEKLSTKVPEGSRMFSIKAPREASAGGWIRPNDYVDVIAVFPSPKTKEPVAQTILQQVPVFATGRIAGSTNVNLVPEKDRAYEEVTLLVDPAQAEKLALFAKLGTLSLSLRNPNDKRSAQAGAEQHIAGAPSP